MSKLNKIPQYVIAKIWLKLIVECSDGLALYFSFAYLTFIALERFCSSTLILKVKESPSEGLNEGFSNALI